MKIRKLYVTLCANILELNLLHQIGQISSEKCSDSCIQKSEDLLKGTVRLDIELTVDPVN